MALGNQKDAEAESSCCLNKLAWIASRGLTLLQTCSHPCFLFFINYAFPVFPEGEAGGYCWVFFVIIRSQTTVQNYNQVYQVQLIKEN